MIAADDDRRDARRLQPPHLPDEEDQGLHRWAAVMEDIARVQDEIDVPRGDDVVNRRRERVLDIHGALIAAGVRAEPRQGAEAEMGVGEMGDTEGTVSHG